MIDIPCKTNFIVHHIDKRKLPSHMDFIDESYRAEVLPGSSSRWCGFQTSSLITRFRLKHNIVRIKQFLYDLGPSSTLGLGAFFDFCPWKIKVVALNENKPAWFGYDNKGRQAMGFLSHLTSIQISAEEGVCEKKDFIDIANALAPIAHHEHVRNERFAHASLWSRFSDAYSYLTILPEYAIPTSLWRARWPIASKDARVMWIVPRQNSILGEWHINSTYVKILDKKAIETGELLLPLHRPSHQIIYRRYISAGPFAPRRPKSTQLPAVDAHSGFAGFRIHVASGNFTYFIASATEHHGPHDAIAWTPENKCIMIQASSMWGFSVEEFVGLLSQLQNDKIRLGDVGCLGR